MGLFIHFNQYLSIEAYIYGAPTSFVNSILTSVAIVCFRRPCYVMKLSLSKYYCIPLRKYLKGISSIGIVKVGLELDSRVASGETVG